MSRVPIRLRVTLGFAGAMAVLLVALGLFIYLRFESRLDDSVDVGLRSRADDVTALAGRSGGGLREATGGVLEDDESFAQFLTPDGAIVDTTRQVASGPVLTDAQLARAARGRVSLERTGLPGVDGPTRVLATPVEAGGRKLIVVVGSSLEERNESSSSLRRLLLIGGPAALIVASLVGYAMAAAALRPVEAMRRRAAAISAAEPDERLPVPEARDELSRLGETLNEMLARLEAAIERERTFVDDASHELRTPLALHKTELEVALRYARSPEELRRAIASAVEEVDRLIQLAEDLLVVARSEKGKLDLELQPVKVAGLLEDVHERFASRAAEAGRSVAIAAPDGLSVEGDRLRLEQALTNMVDNALRYGGGEVRLGATEADGGIELHVEDEGPGFPPEFIDRAFERFSRADSARSRGGTGLGLAIVDSIARAHRGRAGAANRPEGGGADVWIELPAFHGRFIRAG